MYAEPAPCLEMGDIFAAVPIPIVEDTGTIVAYRGPAVVLSHDCAICKPKLEQVSITMAPIFDLSGVVDDVGNPDPNQQGLIQAGKVLKTVYLPPDELMGTGENFADLSQPFTLPLSLFDVDGYLEDDDPAEHRWGMQSNVGWNRRVATLVADGVERLRRGIVRYHRLHELAPPEEN